MELVDLVDQLLGPPQCEGRDEQLAAPAGHPANDLAQAGLGIEDRLVVPVTVGGLDDQGVDRTGGRIGVADDRQARPPDVAREDEPVSAPFRDPEVHRGRAQDVAGVGVLEGQVLAQVVGPAIRQADHQVLHGHRVLQGVEWLALRPRPPALLQKLGVLLLDVCGVGQHHGAEVARGGSGEDRAVESLAHQEGETAGVIDVCVAQYHGVDAPGIHRQVGVLDPGFGAAPLEQPGVEQDPRPGGLEQVHRAGDLAGGAVEGEFEVGHEYWKLAGSRERGAGKDRCNRSLLPAPRSHHSVPNIRSPASPRPGRM